MKLIEYIKLGFTRLVFEYRKNTTRIHTLAIMIAMVLMVTYITHHNNDKTMMENRILNDELLKSQIRLKMMYYIIVSQGDSLNIYKTKLINCQQKELNENNKRTR